MRAIGGETVEADEQLGDVDDQAFGQAARGDAVCRGGNGQIAQGRTRLDGHGGRIVRRLADDEQVNIDTLGCETDALIGNGGDVAVGIALEGAVDACEQEHIRQFQTDRLRVGQRDRGRDTVQDSIRGDRLCGDLTAEATGKQDDAAKFELEDTGKRHIQIAGNVIERSAGDQGDCCEVQFAAIGCCQVRFDFEVTGAEGEALRQAHDSDFVGADSDGGEAERDCLVFGCGCRIIGQSSGPVDDCQL